LFYVELSESFIEKVGSETYGYFRVICIPVYLCTKYTAGLDS